MESVQSSESGANCSPPTSRRHSRATQNKQQTNKQQTNKQNKTKTKQNKKNRYPKRMKISSRGGRGGGGAENTLCMETRIDFNAITEGKQFEREHRGANSIDATFVSEFAPRNSLGSNFIGAVFVAIFAGDFVVVRNNNKKVAPSVFTTRHLVDRTR